MRTPADDQQRHALMAAGETRARRLVAERAGGICERCGAAEAGEWHHRQNRSQGGQWCPANGLHLCGQCHRWITENPQQALDRGLAVPSWLDPAAVPVTLPVWGRVLLDTEGCVVLY